MPIKARKEQLVVPIKGLHYYYAKDLWQAGLLTESSLLKLEPEPDNPYDRYAVQVYLATDLKTTENTTEIATEKPTKQPTPATNLLGYLPRQNAPWSHYLLTHHQIITVKIHQTKLSNHLPNVILIELTYTYKWWHRLLYPIWKLFHPQKRKIR